MDSSSIPVEAVILAAGQGTRMRSRRPKVLHRAAGRPLAAWVLDAARAAGCRRLLVVVGHRADEVREALDSPDVVWVEQAEQLGTGHALAQAAPHLTGEARVLVLSGDVPLVRPATLGRLVEAATGGWGSLAVADLATPGSLGRVLRGPGGTLERIVEAADADEEELAVRTVNAGLYCLPAPEIFGYLERLGTDNAKGELYLTDGLGLAAADGKPIRLVELAEWQEAQGVNDRAELATVHRHLLRRQAAALQAGGVTVWDPERTVIEAGVEVGEDSEIHPGVTLAGATVIGAGATIREGASIRDCRLGRGVVVEPYSVLEGAEVGDGCRVGPFARLRPGARLGAGAKVGNFVEVKNSRLGPGVKASHLTYLGDAEVGEGANVGAGTITCNYDGFQKHSTRIGARASIGSDTLLVAPVEVGDDAETGAGSVITADVPAGALGVSRGRQRNVPGWTRRKRLRRERSE
ncbi:MAG: bifunctional UDP-N-acetylglucosamine diphosphorylase/glucosamine-1-phosphate N-acetyltransferase GlmU [Thermoanaerobaculia bacterium]|nr:bifunctional UDP-N-acetylglucosamine diphosphorylase/glucosamine-1-phosphate N-acetyltransferase GlmU [Thermoanaerobaculia bacterium]